MGQMIINCDSVKRFIILLMLTFSLSGCEAEQKWTTGINSMLDNLAKSYPSVERFLVAFCYVVGIWLMIAGFFKLKRYADMRSSMMGGQAHLGGPIVYILVGVALFYFPEIVKISMTTVWGSASIVKYPDTPSSWKYFTDPVIGLVRIVGYIAFIRGWLLLIRLAQESHQPGTGAKALLHLVGGILAINIVGTINMLGATFD